jgi:hypothetical protein
VTIAAHQGKQMAYKHKAIENRRKAKRNLERLLDEIKTVPKVENMTRQMVSGIAKASDYFMRLENVVGVHIYSEGPNRWYADIDFKDVPEGYSSRIGTPTKAPVHTQAEATEYAKAVLLMLRDTAPTEKRPEAIAFAFDDVVLKLPEKMFQEMVGLKEVTNQEFSEEYIADLMERARARVGGPITSERLDAASQEDYFFVISAALICSLAGNIRWPRFEYDENEGHDSRALFYPGDLSDEELPKQFPWGK